MTRTLELTEFIRTEVALEGQCILFLCLVYIYIYIICVFVAIRIPVYKDRAQRVGLEARAARTWHAASCSAPGADGLCTPRTRQRSFTPAMRTWQRRENLEPGG